MNIFIATAMSGLSNQQYTHLQAYVNGIKQESEHTIFAEITNQYKDNFMSPAEATSQDIEEIAKCDMFILLHLSDVQSSSLFELGLAVGFCKQVVVLMLLTMQHLN